MVVSSCFSGLGQFRLSIDPISKFAYNNSGESISIDISKCIWNVRILCHKRLYKAIWQLKDWRFSLLNKKLKKAEFNLKTFWFFSATTKQIHMSVCHSHSSSPFLISCADIEKQFILRRLFFIKWKTNFFSEKSAWKCYYRRPPLGAIYSTGFSPQLTAAETAPWPPSSSHFSWQKDKSQHITGRGRVLFQQCAFH